MEVASTPLYVRGLNKKNYFSQLVQADKFPPLDKSAQLDRRSCRVENASHWFTKAKIRHEPLEGTSACISREETSALHIAYVSFFEDFLHSYDSTTIKQGPFPT